MRTFVGPANKIRKNATNIETAILEKKILKGEIIPHKSLRYFCVCARGRARVRARSRACGERAHKLACVWGKNLLLRDLVLPHECVYCVIQTEVVLPCHAAEGKILVQRHP